MTWRPNVTVAAIIEREDQYLMVEESVDDQIVINQPAGHLDERESLIEAVCRETLEETAWHFKPDAVTGIYRWCHPSEPITFLRIAFCGQALKLDEGRPLDSGIIRARWMSRDEISAPETRLRSPMVMRCIDDYLAGHRYSLSMLSELA